MLDSLFGQVIMLLGPCSPLWALQRRQGRVKARRQRQNMGDHSLVHQDYLWCANAHGPQAEFLALVDLYRELYSAYALQQCGFITTRLNAKYRIGAKGQRCSDRPNPTIRGSSTTI